MPENTANNEQNKQLRALHRAAQRLMAATSLDDSLDAVSDSLREHLGWERGWIALVDRRRNVLSGKMSFGAAVLREDTAREISLDRKSKLPMLSPVFQKQPLVVRDVMEDSRCEDYRDVLLTQGIESFVIVPTLVHNEATGVISVSGRKGGADFAQEDIDLLTAFADLCALAIENARLYDHMQELSFVDDLTGLPNVRFFRQQLARDLAVAQRGKLPLSLLVVDSDDLKEINDRLGHQAGDTVLVEMAQAIKRSIRAMDVVARYGGDEFVVILMGTDSNGALEVAHRVRQSVAEVALEIDGVPLRTTVSIGIASCPEHASDAGGLFHKADLAMYRAKRGGGNDVAIASSGSSQ